MNVSCLWVETGISSGLSAVGLVPKASVYKQF
jgi:hypothetical protein